jgi:hypothetical protein
MLLTGANVLGNSRLEFSFDAYTYIVELVGDDGNESL